MNASGIFRLGWADLARGLVVAVLSAVLTYLYSGLLGDGTLDLGALDWKKIGGISAAATAAYLLKNLVSDADGKVLGKIGAVALLLAAGLGLSACASGGSGSGAGSSGGGQAADPCTQAGQVITVTSIAVSTAQTGYAVLTAAGTIHPSSDTAALINASFDAANAALAQAAADRLAGKCDVTSYVLAADQALAKAATDIAAAKAAAQAQKDAQKAADKAAKAAAAGKSAAASP